MSGRLFLLVAVLAVFLPASRANRDVKVGMLINDFSRTGPTAKVAQTEPLSVRVGAAAALPQNATTVYKTFVLSWTTMSPDGGPAKRVITVNNKWPAPTIVANVGDRLIVKVINNLDGPSSLHWHGMYQNGTNDMDGVPGVTQNGIMPGQSFTYNFVLHVPGTYWYHSHYKTQYVDGLNGPLIVRDTAQNDELHPNNVIYMGDYYWQFSDVLLAKQLGVPFGGVPSPDSALLNGVGQVNCGGPGQPWCNYARIYTGFPDPCPCDNLDICRRQGGVTRIVNSAGFATIDISIDEHLMWIVAADSVPIVPTVPVGKIRIDEGERYDVVLCRKSDPNDVRYNAPAWIRAHMDQGRWKDVRGILQYDPDSLDWPETSDWWPGEVITVDADLAAAARFNDPMLIDPYKLASRNLPLPPPSTLTIQMEFGVWADPAFNGSLRVHINGLAQIDLSEIKVPLLQLAQTGQPYPISTRNTPGPNIIAVNYNDVVDVVINNHDHSQHPMHLHGQNFWIMARGPGDFPGFGRNIVNTARDTAVVQPNGHMVLRFTARNPGIWLMHCHIDWHMAGGLGMIWSVGMGQ